MKKMLSTRDVLTNLAHYISGNTIDFGAGNAKYRTLIKPHTDTYTTFDMVPGDHIDVVGNALNPPFADASYDTVVSTQMLEHVEKPWVVIHEIERILKPGGICIMTAPFLVPYHADPHDYFRYTKQGMESLFTNEGFSIVESGGYGNAPSMLAEMIHFAYFSHYTKRSKIGAWFRNTVVNSLKWVASKIDRFFHNDALYANTYVVARKLGQLN